MPRESLPCLVSRYSVKIQWLLLEFEFSACLLVDRMDSPAKNNASASSSVCTTRFTRPLTSVSTTCRVSFL